MGRLGTAEEIASLVVYLASDEVYKMLDCVYIHVYIRITLEMDVFFSAVCICDR